MRARLRIVLLSTAFLLGAAGIASSFAENSPDAGTDTIRSLYGSYLAANLARSGNDPTSAMSFYRSALTLDPASKVLMEQAFQTEATEANWKRAISLADELVAGDPNNRMAHLVRGMDRFKSRNYTAADKEFEAASDGLIGELTSALARAWTAVAAGDTDRALKILKTPKQAEGAQYYLNYHAALISDVGGNKKDAAATFDKGYKQHSRILRPAIAYARHAAHNGDTKLAKTILDGLTDRDADEQPAVVRELRDELKDGKDGKDVKLLVSNADEGLAEVFYGLGELLTNEGGVSMGILYLQMALYIQPDHVPSLIALAGAYETARRYADAVTIYSKVDEKNALHSEIDIRKAFDLNSLDKVDEAKAILDKLIEANPKDLKPLDALGTILRSRKRYGEAVEYYNKAIALVPRPAKRHWSLYYSRGTCYERLKNWQPAEADLKKALELYPDQPMVLNYLGYSWVDQNQNLKEGMSLIEKAVALKPDDGYIVDSLGWAHFKLGNYKDSVRFLERAVELKPEDPVLNDHLGDALWKVGREREARYQWDQALTLDPEPEEVDKIKKKLAEGLPGGSQVGATPAETETAKLKKRKETKLNPPRVE
jgi:tetratricopeptide (TPR) repeat protein